MAKSQGKISDSKNRRVQAFAPAFPKPKYYHLTIAYSLDQEKSQSKVINEALKQFFDSMDTAYIAKLMAMQIPDKHDNVKK